MARVNSDPFARGTIVLSVLGAHFAIIAAIPRPTVMVGAPEEYPAPAIRSVLDPVARETERDDRVVLPIPHLQPATVSEVSLREVRFEDPDADLVPNVIGATSAPQPILTSSALRGSYAARAGLLDGESVLVGLMVEVLADGSVGDVQVQMSSGNPDADTQAVGWVRTIRWIPGSRNRHAVSMRIQYTVNLSSAV